MSSLHPPPPHVRVRLCLIEKKAIRPYQITIQIIEENQAIIKLVVLDYSEGLALKITLMRANCIWVYVNIAVKTSVRTIRDAVNHLKYHTKKGSKTEVSCSLIFPLYF